MHRRHSTVLRLTLAVALTGAVGLPGTAPALAAPAPGGLFVFSAPDDQGAERIFTVRPDGTGRTELTGGMPGQQSAPVWSPDGTRIAFNDVATGEPGSNVLVMDADSSNVSAVTTESDPGGLGIFFANLHPTWSADSTEIAFETYREDGDADVYRAGVDGTGTGPTILAEPSLVTPDGTVFGLERQPAWSPDGTRLVFTESLTQNSLALVDASGTGELAYVEAPNDTYSSTQPTWAPDGSAVTYLRQGPSGYSVMVTPLGGTPVDVTPLDGFTDYAGPTFSPDGTQVVFSAYAFATGENALYSVPAPVPPAPRLLPGTSGAAG